MNQVILTQVFTLFLMMAIGIAARRAGHLTEAAVTGLSGLLLRFCLPMMVFGAFLRPFQADLLASAGRMLGYSLAVQVLLVGLGVLLFHRARPERRGILQFITAFSNSGYMGIPLLAALYPDRGVFYGAVFTLAFMVVAFSLGVMVFGAKERPNLRTFLLNPVILAILAGFLCFLGSVHLPQAVTACLNMGGGMTSPLSMLIIGAMLAEMKPRDLLGGRAEYGLCGARLLLAPLLTLAFCRLLHVDLMMSCILVLLESLPAATIVALFVQEYGGDQAFTARCAFLTTAWSLVTIPLLVKVMARVLS